MSTTIAATQEHINQINTIVQQVAATATLAATTTGTAPTNAQKLQAAVQIATMVNPQLATLVTPLEMLISNAVACFNIFKLFGPHNNPAAPAPEAKIQENTGIVPPAVAAPAVAPTPTLGA